MGLPVPLVARLEFDAGHRQARDGRGLASQGLPTLVRRCSTTAPTASFVGGHHPTADNLGDQTKDGAGTERATSISGTKESACRIYCQIRGVKPIAPALECVEHGFDAARR